eukprot:CAMPEP_0119374412 /NCGR_PEP_ID=MMETSP1334-20130426/30587_1 /TAXON_ID=127549 /ORGANISM="Calcidiscus leptoporus, Strain RCC1130" /LENGTH=329 /DNA_ID=CAMNT_0007392479 /DNA_START=165 /DNA_END=1154 /DNA_ORIENTATION=+
MLRRKLMGMLSIATAQLLPTGTTFQATAVNRVVIYTACTDGCTSKPARRFLAMAKSYRLQVVMLGREATWQGFEWMANMYSAAAAALPAETLAIFVDHSDVFIQADAESIASAFYAVSAGKPLVLSLETGCPKGRCTVAANVSSDGHGGSGIPGLRHINGGFVIGHAWAQRKLWSVAAQRSCCRIQHGKRVASAQRGIGAFARAYPELVSFDAPQRLCAVIVNLRTSNEWALHYEFAPPDSTNALPRVRNRHSKAVPGFVHMPGLTGSTKKHLCADKVARKQMLAPLDEVTRLLVPLPGLQAVCGGPLHMNTSETHTELPRGRRGQLLF